MSNQFESDFVADMRPLPTASIWKTFQTAGLVVRFVLWLICLPLELLIHARVGKRYMPTFFVGMSLFLFSTVSILALGAAAALPTVQWGEEMRSIQLQPVALGQVVPFAGLFGAVLIAFVCQYAGNRFRFGTPLQGHSFDPGLSWLGYLAKLLPGPSSKDGSEPFDLTGLPSPPPQVGAAATSGLRELLAYPGAMMGRFGSHFRTHVAKLRNGEAPHGPFNWFLLSLAEPAILLGLGIGLACIPATAPLGVYFIAVAAALFLKGQMGAADWRERIYQDRDAEIEGAAMRALREGAPLDQVSRVFTVPISKAIIPPKRDRGIVAGPAVDPQMSMSDLYPAPSPQPEAERESLTA